MVCKLVLWKSSVVVTLFFKSENSTISFFQHCVKCLESLPNAIPAKRCRIENLGENCPSRQCWPLRWLRMKEWCCLQFDLRFDSDRQAMKMSFVLVTCPSQSDNFFSTFALVI